MSLSTSLLSYEDCLAYYSQAMENEVGIRIRVASEAAAIHLRMRLHKARQLDRERNREIYTDPAHPMHYGTIFDQLFVQLAEDPRGWWVVIQRRQPGGLEVEALGPALPAPERPLALPAPEGEDEFVMAEEQEEPKQIEFVRRA